MPKKGAPLSDADIELVRRWIAEGAVDDRTAKLGGTVFHGKSAYLRAFTCSDDDCLFTRWQVAGN